MDETSMMKVCNEIARNTLSSIGLDNFKKISWFAQNQPKTRVDTSDGGSRETNND